jgi:polysaccharide biosynthesis/export protein
MKPVSKIGIISVWAMVLLLIGCSNQGVIKSESLPVSESDQYVIGPEDVLQIEVWREKSLSDTVPVRADGKISLPLIHDIQAAGLTPLKLQETLMDKLKEFIDDPHVTVIVKEANSFKIYISGQIKTPGVFRLKSNTTLLQIVPMAGGFTDWANQKKILIIRKGEGGETRITANYKKMVDGKVPPLFLKSGDTIIVP